MPNDAKVILVGLDTKNLPSLWAIMTPDRDLHEYTYYSVWTGQEIPIQAGEHLGSWKDGEIINHLFNHYSQ